MATTNGVKLVFGSSPFLGNATVDDVTRWLKALDDLKIDTIDTAQGYGQAEALLGKAGAASRFIIDTKQSSGFSGPPSTKEFIVESGKASLQKLQTDSVSPGSLTVDAWIRVFLLINALQVDVYYLHAPDPRVPLRETLSGINELYKQSAFKRFGLSNFLAHQVEEIIAIANELGFVVPSVYQGNYNAVARRTEDEVFPVLRKHNIAFYAYSPIAGGFLSKSKAELTNPEGRFGNTTSGIGAIYNSMYNRPSLVAALDVWEQIAQSEGIPRSELAYRWAVYHSKLQAGFGDAIIIGSRKEDQLRETVSAVRKGPLSDAAAKRIDEMWDTVKGESALDNYESLRAKA